MKAKYSLHCAAKGNEKKTPLAMSVVADHLAAFDSSSYWTSNMAGTASLSSSMPLFRPRLSTAKPNLNCDDRSTKRNKSNLRKYLVVSFPSKASPFHSWNICILFANMVPKVSMKFTTRNKNKTIFGIFSLQKWIPLSCKKFNLSSFQSRDAK